MFKYKNIIGFILKILKYFNFIDFKIKCINITILLTLLVFIPKILKYFIDFKK
jgi:hypothetical protein